MNYTQEDFSYTDACKDFFTIELNPEKSCLWASAEPTIISLFFDPKEWPDQSLVLKNHVDALAKVVARTMAWLEQHRETIYQLCKLDANDKNLKVGIIEVCLDGCKDEDESNQLYFDDEIAVFIEVISPQQTTPIELFVNTSTHEIDVIS